MSTNKLEERARALFLSDSQRRGPSVWEELLPSERDGYTARAEREGFREDFDPTDPADAVGPGMRGRMDTVQALLRIAQGDAESPCEASELGLDEHAEPQVLYDEADDALRELPLAVEATVQFEVVFGTGGPDDRLVLECERVDGNGPEPEAPATYEIRRVLYRFSWAGKSAEVELSGEDREAAEEFARRVVPELAE